MKLSDAIRARDHLTGFCLPAVDHFLLDNPHLFAYTPAVRTAVTVRAALAHLIGWGLITPTPAEQWPLAAPMRIPQELAPPTRF